VSLFKAPDLQTVQVSKVPEQVSHFGAQGVQSLKFSSKYPINKIFFKKIYLAIKSNQLKKKKQ
jgi:hypothetical protein